mgnify:CR=1 FL=1
MSKIDCQPLLQQQPYRLFMITTGGGAGLQQMFWETPGISSVFAGAEFPYSMEAQDRTLRFKPDRYVNENAAISYAMEAYYRAYEFGCPKAIGLGLTAVTATNKEHKGDHRIHAAWFSEHGCRVVTVTLAKDVGVHARFLDGIHCDMVGLAMIGEALGIDDYKHLLSVESRDASAFAREIFFQKPYFTATGKRLSIKDAELDLQAIFPGAFNPPHEGHFGMGTIFRKTTGLTPTYHITAETPHKPPLTVADMLQRAKMLEGHDRMFTKGDPLYVDKAREFPHTPILIGADSLKRMLDPQWGVDMETLGATFHGYGTTFYVTERTLDGSTIRVSDMELPKGLDVEVLPGRWNISSSEVRAQLTSSSKT